MGENDVGRRIREVRAWRGLSLRATAELTGITHGYLAQLERGEKPVKNRQLLEALARTLPVSPRRVPGRRLRPTGRARHGGVHRYGRTCRLARRLVGG